MIRILKAEAVCSKCEIAREVWAGHIIASSAFGGTGCYAEIYVELPKGWVITKTREIHCPTCQTKKG